MSDYTPMYPDELERAEAALRLKLKTYEELEGSLEEWKLDFNALEVDNKRLEAERDSALQAADGAAHLVTIQNLKARNAELEAEVARLTEALDNLREECTRIDGPPDDYLNALKKADEVLEGSSDE